MDWTLSFANMFDADVLFLYSDISLQIFWDIRAQNILIFPFTWCPKFCSIISPFIFSVNMIYNLLNNSIFNESLLNEKQTNIEMIQDIYLCRLTHEQIWILCILVRSI